MNSFIRIANCRGKKPVLNDLKKAYLTLSNISVEFNSCGAKTNIEKARELIFEIFEKENLEISHSNRLIKKK